MPNRTSLPLTVYGVKCGFSASSPAISPGPTGEPIPLVGNLRTLRLGLKGEPLARWASPLCIATWFPRALPWAWRTAPLRGGDGVQSGAELKCSHHEYSLKFCAGQARIGLRKIDPGSWIRVGRKCAGFLP